MAFGERLLSFGLAERKKGFFFLCSPATCWYIPLAKPNQKWKGQRTWLIWVTQTSVENDLKEQTEIYQEETLDCWKYWQSVKQGVKMEILYYLRQLQGKWQRRYKENMSQQLSGNLWKIIKVITTALEEWLAILWAEVGKSYGERHVNTFIETMILSPCTGPTYFSLQGWTA